MKPNFIDELEISPAARNALKADGIITIEDLTKLTATALLRAPNFGRRRLNEVRGALLHHGLCLSGDKTIQNAIGMAGGSLRDWLAGMAMQGELAAQDPNTGCRYNSTDDDTAELARRSYFLADAMLKARGI